MLAIFGALVAGILTTLAPCVLPLLPVIVGGSVASQPPPGSGIGGQGGVVGGPAQLPGGLSGGAGSSPGGTAAAVATTPTKLRQRYRGPLIITASLGASIMVFTLLLKATTSLIGIPTYVWEWVSGTLLIVLGIVALFPKLWERISAALQLQARSTKRLSSARATQGTGGLVLTGAALGPVFTSCSPLYGYVIVTVLPAEPIYGLTLLVAYVVGLCGTLLAISILGQRAVRGARWVADPDGWFRRGLGAVFIAIGVLVLTGWMKDIETWLILNSPIQPWNLDQGFIPE